MTLQLLHVIFPVCPTSKAPGPESFASVTGNPGVSSDVGGSEALKWNLAQDDRSVLMQRLAPHSAHASPAHVIRRHMPEGARARCAFSVIIPAYNEQLVLEEAVDRVVGLLADVDDYEIVIVEDGCTDYTPLMAAELRARYANVQHIHSAVRLGKGRAVSEGMRAARGRVVVLMDADMATDPAEILRFIRAVERGDADILIGSRYHAESHTRRTSLRLLYSRVYNGAARLLLGTTVRDHQCGFKVFDGDAMRSILPFVKSERFFWDTEALAFAHWFGYRVREVPITWKEGASSKVRLFRTPVEMFSALLRLSITRRWRLP